MRARPSLAPPASVRWQLRGYQGLGSAGRAQSTRTHIQNPLLGILTLELSTALIICRAGARSSWGQEEPQTAAAATSPAQQPLNCVYSLEKVIIEASCLDEKLTFSEDCSGAEWGDKALSCFRGGRAFLPFRALFIAPVDPLDEYGFHEVFFSI